MRTYKKPVPTLRNGGRRATVLRALLCAGALSRADTAKAAGLTKHAAKKALESLVMRNLATFDGSLYRATRLAERWRDGYWLGHDT